MTPSNFLRLLWYPVNSLVMAKSDQDLCLSRSASLGKQLTFSGSCPSGVGSSLQFFSLRCHVKILSLTSHFNLIRNCDFTSNRLIPLDYLPPMWVWIGETFHRSWKDRGVCGGCPDLVPMIHTKIQQWMVMMTIMTINLAGIVTEIWHSTSPLFPSQRTCLLPCAGSQNFFLPCPSLQQSTVMVSCQVDKYPIGCSFTAVVIVIIDKYIQFAVKPFN